MKKLTIFDFDGTIVDVWKRYYQIFCDYWEIDHIKLKEYKELKRQYPNDDELVKSLGLDSLRLISYKDHKRSMLESIYYLRFDSLLVSSTDLQKFFINNNSLVITVRRDKQAYYSQLKWLGLDFIAPKTVLLNPSATDVKVNWVKRYLPESDITVIGDSETDLAFTEMNNCRV